MSKRRQRQQQVTSTAPRSVPQIKPLNEAQADYLHALRTCEQTIVLGPAGTGKTFLAGTAAADGLANGIYERIILTRPNVASGRPIGFRPGSMEDKLAEWFAEPLRVIKERLSAHRGAGAYDCQRRQRGEGEPKPNIELVPFETMRGRSFSNAFVLLDEAQNVTPHEMRMFLTRIGEGCTVVVNGDIRQSDLPCDSGLAAALRLVERHELPVAVVEFTTDDIVRSGMCRLWEEAFERG